MLYRALTSTGDYQIGRFLSNSPQTVGQAIYTRLRLQLGELFWATDSGIDYANDVVGYSDKRVRDATIMDAILNTTGVLQMTQFDSSVDSKRRYTFTATVDTVYGSTTVSA